ncbi:MAG: hypothetical protein IKL34_00800, partial [Alistipes sp.]|nr:hypothetical protein [Alistipes sp.]
GRVGSRLFKPNPTGFGFFIVCAWVYVCVRVFVCLCVGCVRISVRGVYVCAWVYSYACEWSVYPVSGVYAYICGWVYACEWGACVSLCVCAR